MVLVAAVPAWLAWRHDPRPAVATVPVESRAAAATASMPASAATVSGVAGQATTRPAPLPDDWCDDAPRQPPETAEHARRLLRDRARGLALLAAHPDPQAQAAALLLQVETSAAPDEAIAACEADPDGEACALQLGRAWSADRSEHARLVAPRAHALAERAVLSSDPAFYALAWRACHPAYGPLPPGACDRLSVAQWARLEPGNATPWLAAAEAAQQRGDAAGETEAFYRASLATRSDPRSGQLAAIVERSLVDAPDASRGPLVVDAWGLDAAAPMPGYRGLTAHCSAAALRDANRRQVCDALATLLVERSSTLLEHRLGLAIAGRTGWSADRLQAAKADVDRWTALPAIVPTAVGGCAATQALRDWAGEVARHGEIGALRERARRAAAAPAASR